MWRLGPAWLVGGGRDHAEGNRKGGGSWKGGWDRPTHKSLEQIRFKLGVELALTRLVEVVAVICSLLISREREKIFFNKKLSNKTGYQGLLDLF